MIEHQQDCAGILNRIDLLQEILVNHRLWKIEELSLYQYKKEIQRYKLLSYEEEQQLMERAGNGDAIAIKRLTLSHLSFVIHIARKYQNLGLPLNDLISEGNIGLIKAAQKVKRACFRFKTFAAYEIRSSILQAINKYSRSIHHPIDILIKHNTIQQFVSKFLLNNGYYPTDEHIATTMNLSVENVADIRYMTPHEMSIDMLSEYLGNSELLNLIINDYDLIDEGLSSESLSIDVEDALEKLDERERKILKLFFGIGCEEMELPEIGKKLNLTRERTRQLKEKAIRKLKGRKSISLIGYL